MNVINKMLSAQIGSGILVHQEVAPILNSIDSYLLNFGSKKPESITLNTYEWAILDLTLRQATRNKGSLHTTSYNDMVIQCKSGRCYCHHFLDGSGVREAVKDISNYLEIMGDKTPQAIPVDPATKQQLNNWFEYFFDGAFNMDTKPHLALHIIRVTGQYSYKTI